MKPIRIAVFHRGDHYRFDRVDGMFNYAVPGLSWEQFALSKTTQTNLIKYAPSFDLAWLDEGKYKRYQLFTDKRPIPLVFWSLYPTLSESHFDGRVAIAREYADLMLLDHDDLKRWESRVNMPVRRLAYATDETRYRDRGLRRDVDVGFYCIYGLSAERPGLDAWLADYCKRRKWTYGTLGGKGVSWQQYAELLARTKVVVHINRMPRTRPPRIFDCAASGTALLSNPMPQVSGECFEPWVHYGVFNQPASIEYHEYYTAPAFTDDDCRELALGLDWLLEDNHWEHVAARCKAYVLACHTWRQRAVELRGILCDVFPELLER